MAIHNILWGFMFVEHTLYVTVESKGNVSRMTQSLHETCLQYLYLRLDICFEG